MRILTSRGPRGKQELGYFLSDHPTLNSEALEPNTHTLNHTKSCKISSTTFVVHQLLSFPLLTEIAHATLLYTYANTE